VEKTYHRIAVSICLQPGFFKTNRGGALLCSRVLAGFSAMKLRRLSVLVAFAVAGAA
jgi:hypothetical protein